MKNVKTIKSLALTMASALLMSFSVAAVEPATQQQAATDAQATEHKEKAKNLGGGFIAGMSPTQTCLYFKEHYRSKNEFNVLCKMVGRKDFHNLTVVNRNITNGTKRIQQIENIAFFFDESEELRLVMAIEDASYDNGHKREFIQLNQRAQRMAFY